jgi:amino acid transporter
MTENFGAGAAGGNAREQVSVPAIMLMVAGGLGIAYALLSIVMALMGGDAQQEQLNQMLSDPNMPEGLKSVVATSSRFGVIGPIIVLLANGFVLFGALKMKNLESHGLGMAASIIALIPCCPCGCIGIPIGIWSLIVLNKPEVKSAFSRG